MESKKTYKKIELHSEEVQEVMSQIPSWILRNGVTLLFSIVMILLIGSWFFKYPDTITANITITALDPSVSIVARSTGKLDEIYVKNHQKVTAGTPLAVIQNSANKDDMLLLIQMVKQRDFLKFIDCDTLFIFNKKSFALGDIQPFYTAFLDKLNDYQMFKKLNYLPQKITSQRKQLSIQRKHYNQIINQKTVMREQFSVSKKIFERDSILMIKNVISGNEYDIAKKTFLQTKLSYLSFDTAIKQYELQIAQGKENLLDLQKQATELEGKYELSLQNSIEELSAQIKSWERDFLLVSPIDGYVNQMEIWSKNQYVNTGETVFTVVPTSQNKPRGKAFLPIQGAGKVKMGQRVNVRINNFPDKEFGYLIGEVKSISNVPSAGGFYVVEIVFPEGLQTNYGKTLPFTQQLSGSADIITENLRLIERFFMPIKKLLKNQE
ncbi:HlyD family secretion protein [Capnocytophaga felis]|uniref:Hemolysin n=1 Tax=Capnocytophaga felis TaxID=2267611 RepID=A0A5M4BCP7_9FLAO|nr:HlyD family efflux transporter periplasmic adaptor subunit [Capnocytophaga felis]GET47035.1 hemolysin [Capnocytophaga felis]GET49586.1 hemolysin [Capnocytophaga felis]